MPCLSRVGGAAGATYILFITADGFRTDYVEWSSPNIEKLISEECG